MSSDNEFDVVSVGGKVVRVKSGKGGGKGGEGRGSKERLVGEGQGEVITVSESDDDNDDKEDSREKKKGIKVTKNLKYHPDLVAVRIIREFISFHKFLDINLSILLVVLLVLEEEIC